MVVVESGGFFTFSTEFSTIHCEFAVETARKGAGTMLYGRFEYTVDAKGRIFVPVKLREKLGTSFVAATVLDPCVSLYSAEEWESLLEKLSSAPMAETRKLLRKVTQSAEDVTLDAQGRILLSKPLLAHARLEKPALIIGAGRRAEIWNPEVYDQVMEDMTDEKAEEAFRQYGF